MAWKGWADFVPKPRANVGRSVWASPVPAPIPMVLEPTRSKYGARPCRVVDRQIVPVDDSRPGGIRFDSEREAKRYLVLLDDLDRGQIADLVTQRPFFLAVVTPEHVRSVIGTYVADFVYTRGGKMVVEDAKGVRTPIFVWKKKHVEAQYGVRIMEV